MINIGINGFGRIGKLLSRIIINDPRLRLVSINHPTITRDDYLHLLSYDTVHPLADSFDINKAQSVTIHNSSSPSDILWENEIDIILDTTGKFKTHDSLMSHKQGTHLDDDTTIILTAPPADDIPMFVYGVNHVKYNFQNVISAASCTTTCLAPIVKVLHDNYNIKSGLATTIHSVTASQFTVDKYTPGKRTGRSIINNIIPSSTGAANALGKVIPELEGKLNAVSVRVPVSNVSLLDLSVTLEKNPEVTEILDLFTELSKSPDYYNIIDVSDKMLVSSDYIGNKNNAVIDSLSTMKMNDMYKFLIWYDNEMGYASNIIRFIKYIKF
tara:strand:- start:1234 stop:2214 length:981 start_codon:yes stop_codon:yes gene_type:complete